LTTSATAAEQRGRGTRFRSAQRGAGLLGTSFGVLFFVSFLFFAVQLLFNLYATSVVTSAAYDAARAVATGPVQPATQPQLDAAVDHARSLLGKYRDRATFDWDLSDPEVVRLHVHAVNPRVLAPPLDELVGLDVIDRTVVVRVEKRQ
jgi:hypothetical protein